MKILLGITSFLIFAVSMPVASQNYVFNDADNNYRIQFFNQSITPTCTVPDTNKLAIVKNIEQQHLVLLDSTEVGKVFSFKIEGNKNRVTQQMANTVSTYCQTEARVAGQNNYAQNSANAAAAAAAAGYNSANTRSNVGSGSAAAGSGSSVAQRTAVAGGLIAGIGGLEKDLKEIKKDEAKAAAEAAALAKKEAAKTPAASNASAAPAQAATVASVTATPTSANLSVSSVNDSFALANSVPAIGIVSMGDGTQIDFQDKSVTFVGAEGNLYTKYKWDNKAQEFRSPDGDPIKSADMHKALCKDTECATDMKELQADSQTSGATGEILTTAPSAPDAATTAGQNASKAEASAFEQAVASSFASIPPSCSGLANQIIALARTHAGQYGFCGGSQATATFLCSWIRSPKAAAVQKLMSVGSLVISQSGSASATCSSAGKFARVAQTGLTAANLVCTGAKFTCDISCGLADSSIQSMSTAASTALGSCLTVLHPQVTMAAANGVDLSPLYTQAEAAFASVRTVIAAQLPQPKAKIALCEKHDADIAQMALQILSVIDSKNQAKACKVALANADGGGGSGGGAGGGNISMEEFCKIPAQAGIPPCKCRTEPSAVGCPGHIANSIASSGNSDSSNKTGGSGSTNLRTGSASQLAGPGGIGSLSKTSKSGLSAEAKAALGINSQGTGSVNNAKEKFSNSSGQNGGSAANGSPATAGTASPDRAAASVGNSELAGKKADDKNLKLGTFESISSGGYGSYGSDRKLGANSKKYTPEEIAVMAARKIATEEFQQQVTTASGKSNWDKVKVRYDENRISLFEVP